MTVVYIGLGSNMELPVRHVTTALDELAALEQTQLLGNSSLYQSKPVGPQDQDDFINAVAKLATRLPALALLDALQSIENLHDRRRTRHWGPRTLDLDILAYGDEIIDTERLSVPHPQIRHRSFVLLPWLELEPAYCLPGHGSIGDLLDSLDEPLPEKLP